MSFMIECPNCGSRSAYEFRFGGELRRRPSSQASDAEFTDYFYNRANLNGVQTEWWYHRDGCGKWLVAERDTISNEVKRTYWVEKSSQ